MSAGGDRAGDRDRSGPLEHLGDRAQPCRATPIGAPTVAPPADAGARRARSSAARAARSVQPVDVALASARRARWRGPRAVVRDVDDGPHLQARRGDGWPPATSRRRAPSAVAAGTRRPSSSSAATPGMSSTQRSSSSSSSTSVAPVTGSAASTSRRRWSRDCTVTSSGPRSGQRRRPGTGALRGPSGPRRREPSGRRRGA